LFHPPLFYIFPFPFLPSVFIRFEVSTSPVAPMRTWLHDEALPPQNLSLSLSLSLLIGSKPFLDTRIKEQRNPWTLAIVSAATRNLFRSVFKQRPEMSPLPSGYNAIFLWV
jgi:hypothetical protein